jgi:hypothetical protein
MLLVKEGVEGSMEGLDLCLRRATEKMVALSELDRVVQHVELRKCGLRGLGTPVLMDIVDCRTPIGELLRCPLALVQQMIVQLLQPACEDGVRCSDSSSDVAGSSSRSEECGAASLLDPLANLGPVEIIEITLASAASRVDGRHTLQRLFDVFLTQQLIECIEDDAIADAEEEVESAHRTDTKRTGSMMNAPPSNVPVSVACDVASCCLQLIIVCSEGM